MDRPKRKRARRRAELQQQAARDPVRLPEWWDEGLHEAPTEEIVVTLASIGIQTESHETDRAD